MPSRIKYILAKPKDLDAFALQAKATAGHFIIWRSPKQDLNITQGEWLAVDGKSIKATVQLANQSYQNFVNLVSIYSHKQGVVVAMRQFENHQTSEIKVVETLLETLNLKGVVFTFDALHCQKKQYS